MGGKAHGAIRHVSAELQTVVLVCRKCSKKIDGGFGRHGDTSLVKVLRRRLGPKSKPRRASAVVLEVGCVDLCPKNAVVVMRGDRPKDWLVVPRGTAIDDIAATLALSPSRRALEI